MKYNKILVLSLFLSIISFCFPIVIEALVVHGESEVVSATEPTADVKITSPADNQTVPVGNLTIFGTSNTNPNDNCTVYVSWNDRMPFQRAVANGNGGPNYNYSHWNFTLTSAYHEITNGTNNLSSILSCSAIPTNFTKVYSINVTGFISTDLNSKFLSDIFPHDSADSSSSDNSFMNSQEYLLGSTAFRACIGAAADVGNKLSDYEIENCREDPSYRHSSGDGGESYVGDSTNSDSSSNSDTTTRDQSNADTSSASGSGGSNVCATSPSNSGPSSADGEFNIGTAGDWANQKNACDTALNMVSKNVDMAIGLGDYAYSTSSKAVDVWWNNIMGSLHGIFKGALGNHDVGDESTYAKDFGQSGPWYYSFNNHGIHFVAINTETSFGPGSAQYKFVSNDLASASSDNTVKWIVVFFHRPMYTSPSHHAPLTVLRDAYHPLFDKYGVDLVLQAHNHNYQRTFPISYNSKNPSSPILTSTEKITYNDPTGQIYTEVGTGGQSSYSLDSKFSFVNQQFTTSGGFLNLAFPNTSTLKATFYDNDGTSRDQFTIHKSEFKAVAFTKSISSSNTTTNEDTPVLIQATPENENNKYGNYPTSGTVLSMQQPFPQHGSFKINPNKTITYTPDHDYFGTDVLTYSKAATNSKAIVTDKVGIRITPVNDAPIANDDEAFVKEGNGSPTASASASAIATVTATATVDVLANDTDVDGDSLSISKVYPSAASENWPIVNNGDGTLTFTAPRGFTGQQYFSYIVIDGNGANDTGLITIKSNKTDEPPTALNQNLTIATNRTLPIKLSASTSDVGQSLSYSLNSQPIHGITEGLDQQSGNINYVPDGGYNGTDAFTFLASNGRSNSNVATIHIRIIPSNQASPASSDTNRSKIDLLQYPSNSSITVADGNSVPENDSRHIVMDYNNTLAYQIRSSNRITDDDQSFNSSQLIRNAAPPATMELNLNGTLIRQSLDNTIAGSDLVRKYLDLTKVNERAGEQAQLAIKEAEAHNLKSNLLTAISRGQSESESESKSESHHDLITSEHMQKSASSITSSVEQQTGVVQDKFSQNLNENKKEDKEVNQRASQQAQISLDKAEKYLQEAYAKELQHQHLATKPESLKKLESKDSTEKKNAYAVEELIGAMAKPLSKQSPTTIVSHKITGQKQIEEKINERASQQAHDLNNNAQKNEIHSNEGEQMKTNHVLPYQDTSHAADTKTSKALSNHKPHATAGLDITVPEQTIVNLDGTKSSDRDGDGLSYSWKQIQGPRIKLANPEKSVASFVTPSIRSGLEKTVLRFQLTVDDRSGGDNRYGIDFMTVIVKQKVSVQEEPKAKTENNVQKHSVDDPTHKVSKIQPEQQQRDPVIEAQQAAKPEGNDDKDPDNSNLSDHSQLLPSSGPAAKDSGQSP